VGGGTLGEKVSGKKGEKSLGFRGGECPACGEGGSAESPWEKRRGIGEKVQRNFKDHSLKVVVELAEEIEKGTGNSILTTNRQKRSLVTNVLEKMILSTFLGSGTQSKEISCERDVFVVSKKREKKE